MYLCSCCFGSFDFVLCLHSFVSLLASFDKCLRQVVNWWSGDLSWKLRLLGLGTRTLNLGLANLGFRQVAAHAPWVLPLSVAAQFGLGARLRIRAGLLSSLWADLIKGPSRQRLEFGPFCKLGGWA